MGVAYIAGRLDNSPSLGCPPLSPPTYQVFRAPPKYATRVGILDLEPSPRNPDQHRIEAA